MNCTQSFIASLIRGKGLKQIDRILTAFMKVSLFNRLWKVIGRRGKWKIDILIAFLVQTSKFRCHEVERRSHAVYAVSYYRTRNQASAFPAKCYWGKSARNLNKRNCDASFQRRIFCV